MRGWHALALYLTLSFLFFGLEVADNPRGEIIGANDVEPSVFVWFLAWWPDAILEARNPFVTGLIYVPEGLNVTWAAGIPGLSLPLAPLTLAAGPVVAYNVLQVAAPALGSFTAFLLCRHVTGHFWSALAGGFVYGFSAYGIYTLAGVAHLSFTALPPLVAYLVVRRVDGTLEARRFTVSLTLTLALQFLIAPERFALILVCGGVAGTLAFALMPDRRAALGRAARGVAIGYAGAVVLLAPYLYYMFFRPSVRPVYAIPENFSVDLLSFLVPTPLHALGGGSFLDLAERFGGAGGSGAAGVAYLGVPLLVLIALFAVEAWGTQGGKLLLGCLASFAVLALGPRLVVAGDATVPLPERLLAELPLLKYAIPSHFALFCSLVAALMVTMWLGAGRSRWRWLLMAAVVAALIPNLGSAPLYGVPSGSGRGLFHTPTDTPAFFRSDLHKRFLSDDDVVLALPTVGACNRWQALASFDFAVSCGYVSLQPRGQRRFERDLARLYSARVPPTADEIGLLLRGRGITAVVTTDPIDPRWARVLRPLGVPPKRIGGVLIFRLQSR